MARRERICTVLRRAQLLHLEKRTEHAWRLHQQSLDQWLGGRWMFGVWGIWSRALLKDCLSLSRTRFFFGRRGRTTNFHMFPLVRSRIEGKTQLPILPCPTCFLDFFFWMWCCCQHASTNTRHNRQERSHRERFWLKLMEAVAVLAAVKRIQVG